MSVDQTIELVSGMQIRLWGDIYDVTDANILRYAAIKRRTQQAVLKKYRSSRGIVVKKRVKGETKVLSKKV